jgi:FKBP-type peptidyl-prolyl cis-trans isomerase
MNGLFSGETTMKTKTYLIATLFLLSIVGGIAWAEDGDIPAPSDVAAVPEDAEITESGLASKVIKEGSGTEHPTAASKVTVHYTGWKTDGTMFDSSVKRDAKATFPLGGVIKGWTEGLQLMVVGEKRRFWIPANLAYGENGRVPGMLVFDVELFEIE